MLEIIFKEYYPLYVAVLNILVHVAMALSVLVSLDRLVCILKYAFIKLENISNSNWTILLYNP